MDKDDLLHQLMPTFLDELSERVERMNRCLLALEKEPAVRERAELLKGLLREVHTIKGISRQVGLGVLADVCHPLEDLLLEVQQHHHPFSPELFSLLFKTADGIEATGMLLRDEQSLDDSPLHELLLELEAAAAGNVEPPLPAPGATSEPTTAAELPTEPATVRAAASSSAVTAPLPTAVSPAPERTPMEPVSAPREPTRPPEASPVVQPAAEKRAHPETAAPAKAAAATLRVAAEKLDSLMAQSGELLVARRRVESRFLDVEQLRDLVAAWRREWRGIELPLRSLLPSDRAVADETAERIAPLSRRAAATVAQNGERLRQLERKLDQVASQLAADGRMLRHTCDALDDDVEHLRMFPFADACAGLERAVRDLARAASKDARLVIEGGDVQVDRSVLEGLKDPLLHLVRNAVDHGLELPGDRERAGKPPQGTVTVSAALRGTQVEVVVADDGRGFNLDRIREKIRQKGLPEPQDERELARTVFLPGFSTAEIITEVSGRGVGLDVVQHRAETLHGTVDVAFQTGQGTRFTLSVPLTLTKIHCVLLVAGGHTYAIATVHVVQLLRFSPEQIRTVAGRDALLLGDAPICLASLAATLGSRDDAQQHDAKRLAFVLTSGIQQAAFVVDEVLGEQEIVVKSLGPHVRRLRHVSGGTILPSGRVALVLNVPSLIRTALGGVGTARLAAEAAKPAVTAPPRKRLLVVEDSLTTRTLLKSILETAGYEVATAADGEQAWQFLAARSVDLVVADVDMPRLDGFGLTRKIRSSPRHQRLPLILVTARETDQDKARGIDVGANAYLLKSAFDQRNLLECIAQLL